MNSMPKEDLYADDSMSPAASGKAPDGAEAKDGQDNEKTALIDKSLCPDMKVGDTIALKIVAEHDGEFAVAYQPQEEKEESAEAKPGAMSSMKEPAMSSESNGMYD